LTKHELFRQRVLCDIEAETARDGAEYNLMIVKIVIEKKGWQQDYIDWFHDQGSKYFKRHKAFPKEAVLGMLD